MKKWKKFLALMLTLVMCLSLAACGGDSSDDSGDAPDSFEGMVADSDYMADFDTYAGAWRGEDDSALLVEQAESGNELRFALYDAVEDLTASGYIQYAPEYGFDYFYNEHDGMAYRAWSDENGALHVDTLGTFTQETGSVPDDSDEDDAPSDDYSFLAGVWFLDADAAADSIIEIDEYGNWSLSDRPGGDGDPTEVDCGTIQMNPDGEDQYYAVSTMFDDVVYDMTVIGDDVMYWGGENDYYQKMA